MDKNCTVVVGKLMNQDRKAGESVKTSLFSRKRGYVLPKGDVGLESMSSVDVFGEAMLQNNIRTVFYSMRIVCSAGIVVVTEMGTFMWYGDVTHYCGAVANILSPNNVQKQFQVTYDSANGSQFVVHKKNGTVRFFTAREQGVYVSQVVGT